MASFCSQRAGVDDYEYIYIYIYMNIYIYNVNECVMNMTEYLCTSYKL